jgi:hypothetical protein
MNDAMKEDIMCQVCMQQDGMPGSKFCKPNLDIREIDIDKCPVRIEVARRFLEVLKAECIGENEEADSKIDKPIFEDEQLLNKEKQDE